MVVVVKVLYPVEQNEVCAQPSSFAKARLLLQKKTKKNKFVELSTTI